MFNREAVISAIVDQNITIACAESCTGGLLSDAFVQNAGISSVFLEGVVTYSNDAKIRLGVSSDTISKHGAVSHETAMEMALCIRKRASSDIGISTTGIAGPGGGTDKKTVGLVYVGISTEKVTTSFVFRFCGDRTMVRIKTVNAIFLILNTLLKENHDGMD